MKTPKPSNIHEFIFECTCADISMTQWNKLMKGAVRASKQNIDQAIKLFLPDLYSCLRLDLYNPYNYFKTQTHLIMVHSGIEYFFRWS